MRILYDLESKITTHIKVIDFKKTRFFLTYVVIS